MTEVVKRKIRCAIYTRKSSEEGLDMEFNSLNAQRDACAAFIASQKSEGWVQLDTQYDDGGYSGGTLDRPAIKQLMIDIEASRINCVVVYKIDRISRSLSDFSRLMETFEKHEVAFVSVTQSFNTSTAMGRLTLNILLSFGQFERELTGERIRDKFLASRKRGIFMGGPVPLGYLVKDRKLVIQEKEAKVVRMVFERFISLGSATKLAQQLAAEAVLTRSGKKFDKGVIYKLLNNQVYIGLAVHKGEAYEGEHDGIIPLTIWDKVHEILKTNSRQRAAQTRRQTPALLKGLIFGPDGAALSPTHTRRRGKLYRYYVSQTVLKGGASDCLVPRVPAGEVENAVINKLRVMLHAPEILVGVSRIAQEKLKGLAEGDVLQAIKVLDHLWDELFPAEQARVFQLLVARIDVDPDGIDIQFRADGFATVVGEIQQKPSGKESGLKNNSQAASLITVRVPMALRKYGGTKRIVAPDGSDLSPQPKQPDSTLVKALSRAFRWKKLLENGTFNTIADLSKSEKINSSYVSRVLRLTLLAPDVVEAILSADLNRAVTIDRLMKPLPADWQKQRQLLNASGPRIAKSGA